MHWWNIHRFFPHLCTCRLVYIGCPMKHSNTFISTPKHILIWQWTHNHGKFKAVAACAFPFCFANCLLSSLHFYAAPLLTFLISKHAASSIPPRHFPHSAQLIWFCFSEKNTTKPLLEILVYVTCVWWSQNDVEKRHLLSSLSLLLSCDVPRADSIW